jgi:hypothetical protein
MQAGVKCFPSKADRAILRYFGFIIFQSHHFKNLFCHLMQHLTLYYSVLQVRVLHVTEVWLIKFSKYDLCYSTVKQRQQKLEELNFGAKKSGERVIPLKHKSQQLSVGQFFCYMLDFF